MASETPADNPVATNPTLPDRTADNAAPQGEVSKNAAKKAAKLAKQASDKADKNVNKGIGKSEAKKPTSKAQGKKSDGPALIGIDVTKEEDFPGWYQQVLTKGDMLDYYNVSGCFVLKVGYHALSEFLLRIVTDILLARFVLHLGGNPKLVQCAHQEDWRQELLVPAVRLRGCA